MVSIPQVDIDSFDAAVSQHFSFLESEFDLRRTGVSVVDEDPRDSYMVAKYRQGEFRVDIAWNPFAMSLGVLLRVENGELGRRERYVYLEPFIEFMSNGEITPVVPQIYPSMSVGKIEKTMELREKRFAAGVEDPLSELANRLKIHLPEIRSCKSQVVRDYQDWYQSFGGS